MTDNNATADKSIVAELNYGKKTAKRVGWESFEFAVEGPHLVRVTNASYGFEKADHSYLVGVEDHDGLLVPAECECPADKYNEEYDCKHKVALATVGGPVVLQAAVDCPTPTVDGENTNSETLKDKLRTDGGAVTDETEDPSPPLNASKHSECDCTAYSDFPCFDCYRDGHKELPE
jgi:hypothetical protein